MKPTSDPRPESLIAGEDWVRPLVQRLVRDEASAQDVLQSTWLRALRHPPRAERGSPSWRSWFVRVARNLASRESGRASARRERELRAARGDSQPSTLEISEREELRAKIVAHVLALPEPYRTALVLRFYEGLAPRAIARAQGTNGSTVRNRIARGLALLRERLEREKGRDWVSACLAVLPLGSAQLLVAHAGWVGWLAKGGVVAKKIEITTAAAVVLTAGVVWFAWPSRSAVDALGQKHGAEAALSSESSGVALPRAGAVQDALLDNADAGSGAHKAGQQRKPADSAELADAGAGVRVFGAVRDARGAPISNSGGTFRLQMGGESGRADVPALNFYSARDLQQKEVQGVQLELTMRIEQKLALDVAEDHARELVVVSVDSLRSEELGKTLRRLVLLGSTRIVFADAEGCQFTADANTDSSYSAEGLHAGKWHAIVTHDGKLCRRQDFEIQPGEHQHQLDVALDDALQVRVKLRTPDGGELNQAIAADPELAFRAALSPVALRPGSAARYLPDGENQDFGCGHYEPRAQLDEKRRDEIGEASGVLTLTEAPPLEVGLVMSGAPIARRSLAPGQEEVEFVLSLEDLRRCFATVLVHVVDAQTHVPIAGASVSIDGVRTQVETPAADASAESAERAEEDKRAADEKRSGPQGVSTDAQGVARIPWVMPGKRRVCVEAKAYSAFSGRLEIEGGGTCELRPIELTGRARISGRILDANGKPVNTRLQVLPLDRFDETREDLAGINWESSENGAFDAPNLRRERYLVRICEGESALGLLVVDASQGDVADLELHLQPAVEVKVHFTREPKEGAELRISTAAGLPVLERDLAGLAPAELALVPGAYTAELREGAHRAGSVRFVVEKDALRVVLPLD